MGRQSVLEDESVREPRVKKVKSVLNISSSSSRQCDDIINYMFLTEQRQRMPLTELAPSMTFLAEKEEHFG